MDSMFVIRGRVQELYASHSRIFDKAVRLLLNRRAGRPFI